MASNAAARRPPILYESTISSDSVGRRPRGLQVSGSDRDLDLCRQSPEAEERLCGVLNGSRDPCHCSVDLALGQPEEREARLRLAAHFARHAVRLLGTREVAAATTNLGDLVVAARGDHAVEVVQLFTCGDGLCLCGRPVAAKPERLGSMNPTCAREASDVEAVAPAARRLGPLGRSTEVADVLARADRDAVDEAGRVRAQIAAHRRRARLVEQGEALVDLAGLDQAPALPGQREHLHVSAAHTLSDLVRLVEELDGAVEIALGEHRRQRMDETQPTMLRGFGQIGEKPLGAREPPARDRERAASLVVPTQGERDSSSAQCRRPRSHRRRTHARGGRSPPRASRSTRLPRRSSRDLRR